MAGAPAIIAVDPMLRGGAAVLLLLTALLLARDHGGRPSARLGVTLAIGAAVFAAATALRDRAGATLGIRTVLALTGGNAAVFWLFARAVFDDDFRLRPWHVAAWALMVAPALVCAIVLRPRHPALAAPLDTAITLGGLAFAVLAVVQTASSWAADLVDPRRAVRVRVIGATAAYIALTSAANLLGAYGGAPNWASLVEAFLLLLIAAGVAWSFLGVARAEALFGAPAPAKPQVADAPPLTAVDRLALAAVERAMRVDRAYRTDGLTIGALAAAQRMPEHRLRRLINLGLGHRNFNAFLNAYRIEEVKAA